MDLAHFPWLTTAILFPIVASLAIPFLPDENGRTVRWYALVVGLIDFIILVAAFYLAYDPTQSGLQ
ncbi:MAG: NAD(P)H-quinone oxidoreductase subunit 4, partial [Cyanobacteria bacterium Co-bin13]|nr:NAD(P)H-quinone oxidoreductase subunit 4 [Cyanobacteria bacterium Co-bin13]